MGIGNADGPRLQDVPLDLITPHGDWKLAIVGNRAVDIHDLITPHGDWKPAAEGS